MMFRQKRRGGVVSNILTAILILVGIYVIYINVGDPEVAKARERQKTPEAALRFYLEKAYGFMTGNENVAFGDIKLAVARADWDWYNANYKRMHFDAFNLGSALDPNEADALARRSVLKGLLSIGPNRTDTQILSQTQVSNTSAMFHLKYLGPIPDTFKESNVEVIREDDVWKVKDFAGGRKASQLQ